MTPSFFLLFSGTISLFIGILGILQAGFLPYFWFDFPENLVHTGFGALALWAARRASMAFQRQFVLWTSLLAFVIGVLGVVVQDQPSPNFFGITNLEHPLDNALHLTFGIVGLWASVSGKGKGHGIA